MDQSLCMHMVPAADTATLKEFHLQGLGWTTWGSKMSGSFMRRAATAVIVFMDRNYLAAESGMDVSPTSRAINALFVQGKSDVDSQIANAVAAGATVTSAVRDRDGGLLSGYSTDLKGNGWGIVWSPFMRPTEHGGLVLKMQ
ncbi:hypothetical protein FHS52_002919 [Erythromicrobium ramosum]|uniref:VOC domain-containing protein n=1 Tax=Erythrobacter ramosus TaxID=35811 RepID=A0ABR6I1Y2_9SPHN|nr:hypothetical protein [Erythrobacter ramosus]MBB3776926.1 hypothetical protein [Erythrobacter ramosus]